MHLELDLLDPRGHLLDRTTNDLGLNLLKFTTVSAPTTLSRDGKWRTVEFSVTNTATTGFAAITTRASAVCHDVNGGFCKQTRTGPGRVAVEGIHVQWSAPDGWRDLPTTTPTSDASGAVGERDPDVARFSLPVGGSRHVRLRVAASPQVRQGAELELGLGASIPEQDGKPTPGPGAVAKMTVH
ncbi:hypothetical protein AQI95_31710 [Streptomyces yokosukanensis]|uniref:Uncharacterized protein n=1 Tax=Streptomyces yokosukanensis TaxID=67386 RepID=A0A101NY65_9ACTN|nr:hypothetical protein AQI95_31710 [Streptomyces yokosukanensis]